MQPCFSTGEQTADGGYGWTVEGRYILVLKKNSSLFCSWYDWVFSM